MFDELKQDLELCKQKSVSLQTAMMSLSEQITDAKWLSESELRSTLEEILGLMEQQKKTVAAFQQVFPDKELPNTLQCAEQTLMEYEQERERRQALENARKIEWQFSEIQSHKEADQAILNGYLEKLCRIGTVCTELETYQAQTAPYAAFLNAVMEQDSSLRLNLSMPLRESGVFDNAILVSLVWGDLYVSENAVQPEASVLEQTVSHTESSSKINPTSIQAEPTAPSVDDRLPTEAETDYETALSVEDTLAPECTYDLPGWTRSQYTTPVIRKGAEDESVTAKNYRKDMEKYHQAAGFCMKTLMGKFGCVTNAYLNACKPASRVTVDFTQTLDFLTNKGYFRKISVEGFEPIFNSSPKGDRAFFKYDDMAKKLAMNAENGSTELTLSEERQINAALVRIGMVELLTHYESLRHHPIIYSSKENSGMSDLYIYHTSVITSKMGRSARMLFHAVCLTEDADRADYVEWIAGSFRKLQEPLSIAIIACETLNECSRFFRFWEERGMLGKQVKKFSYVIPEHQFYLDGEPIEATAFTVSCLAVLEPKEDEKVQDNTVPTKVDDIPVPKPIAEKHPPVSKESAPEPTETSQPEEASSPAEPERSTPVYQALPATPEPVTSSIDKKYFIRMIYEMMISDKPYCAVAYARTAALKDPDLRQFSRELSYAYNDPAEGCHYVSSEVMNHFAEENVLFPELEEYLQLCTVLRSLFLNEPHDFQFRQLYDIVRNSKVIEDNEALSKLLYALTTFKDNNDHMGIDAVADYRMKQHLEYARLIEETSANAKQEYQEKVLSPVKEAASFKRFVDMQRMMLQRDSNLSECLKFAADDNRDSFNLEFIRDFMHSNNFIAEKAEIISRNICMDGIEAFIDYYWNAVNNKQREKHKSTKLTGARRQKMMNTLRRLLSVIADWYYYVTANTVQTSGTEYTRNKKQIHALVTDACEICRNSQNAKSELYFQAGIAALCAVLEEFEARLTGNYVEKGNRYFYAPFLQHGEVMLRQDFIPDIQPVFARIDGFTSMERIERHAQLPERSYQQRVDEIFGRGEDPLTAEDYGCASLLREYLKNEQGIDWDDEHNNIDGNTQDAMRQMTTIHSNFVGSLELAQSYGQITIDKKEQLLSLIDQQFILAREETHNFGFFRRLLQCCEQNIRETAKSREKDLSAFLQSLVRENSGEDTRIASLIESAHDMMEQQNYTVVEDIVRRIQAKDFSGDVFSYPTEDYLGRFLDEYDANYIKVRNPSVSLARTLKQGGRPMKDMKGGNQLIEHFPSSNSAAFQHLPPFLVALGFEINRVMQTKHDDCYDVSLKTPQNLRKESFTHPISPFGSLAVQDGFRIACLFGTFDCSRLLDKFRSIGPASHTLVTLDYALGLSDRQELARRIKAEMPDKVFIVIDRVVVTFLANHYAKHSVNRILMEITLPFGCFQPYTTNATTAIPPEMFMGRKEMLLDIESPKGANIICGGRQLGKSALLRMAKNDIDHDERGNRAVYIDVKDKDYEETAHLISLELIDTGILGAESECSNWESLCRNIRNRLSFNGQDKIPFFLLLIDEADCFLESCKNIDYAPFKHLENIQTYFPEGRFKFVIAGLRNLVRFEHEKATSNNSVLAHMSSKTIRPFNAGEAMELLLQPLHYLGIRFPKDKQYLIWLILASTNYFPGLIHYYCACLLDAMRKGDYAGYITNQTPPYELTEDHIKKVLADESFNRQIKEKFTITLKLDTDNFYDIIATLMAYLCYTKMDADGYLAKQIFTLAEEYEITKITVIGLEKLEVLMDELCELNILRKNSVTGKFLFARYNFIQLLGTLDEIERKILQYMEEC